MFISKSSRGIIRALVSGIALCLAAIAIMAVKLDQAKSQLERSIPLITADEFTVGKPVTIDRFFTADLHLSIGEDAISQETYFILVHDQRAPRTGYNGMAFAIVPTSATSFDPDGDVPVGTMMMQPVIGEGSMGIRAVLHPRKVEARDPSVPKLALTAVTYTPTR